MALNVREVSCQGGHKDNISSPTHHNISQIREEKMTLVAARATPRRIKVDNPERKEDYQLSRDIKRRFVPGCTRS
jgi:hypothetical protein